MKFIFEVRLKPGRTVAEYAAAWVRASEIIQQAPGARGTELHRKLDDDSTLLAIAQWDTKEARDRREEFLRPDRTMRAILDAHMDIVDFKLIGEYDDPEWVVLPPASASNDIRGASHP